MKCENCEEEVTDADIAAGAQQLPVIVDVKFLNGTDGLAEVEYRKITLHRECFLVQGFGTVGHQKGTCKCFGGVGNGNPPGVTRRQAAIEAVALAFATMAADTGGVH